MNRFDRIFKLHQLFKARKYPIPRATIEKELQCTRATVRRVINELKDIFHAPIVYDRTQNGYYYDPQGACTFELPGLWFNASELHALLAAQHLLKEVQPGLLAPRIAPLQKRIDEILRFRRRGKTAIARHIRILGMGVRTTRQEHFLTLANALAERSQIRLTYHSRSQDRTTRRLVSPQRLIHYRDNWYLDAWDHRKNALRSFAVDRIRESKIQKQKSKILSDKVLDDYFTRSFGIFSGKPAHTAILRFSAECSRWVAEETWHPEQKGRFEKGDYILEIPYADTRELVMDILKYGPSVEVLGPRTLRQKVKQALAAALKKY